MVLPVCLVYLPTQTGRYVGVRAVGRSMVLGGFNAEGALFNAARPLFNAEDAGERRGIAGELRIWGERRGVALPLKWRATLANSAFAE